MVDFIEWISMAIIYGMMCYRYLSKIKKLEDKNKELDQKNTELLMRLAFQQTTRFKVDTRPKSNYDKDVVEAVRFAMLQSHPDQPNGNHDKFIKYKNLYEQMKG